MLHRQVTAVASAAFGRKGVIETFKLSLRQRRCHAISHIQTRQGRGLVDAAVLSVDKALPAKLFQIGKLQITPGLNPFGNMLQIILGLVESDLLAQGVHQTNFPVIEIRCQIRVDDTHAVRVMAVKIRQHQILVGRIFQNNFVKKFQRKLGKSDIFFGIH
ncbi:hypothetical protein GALL_502290 [mine drainage metagenome]|uniref:Uncharacterized protein n=1 Tax=mine drainage metagenome TaxID=410659 RepID=A0A1J5PK51_9ZZZZ